MSLKHPNLTAYQMNRKGEVRGVGVLQLRTDISTPCKGHIDDLDNSRRVVYVSGGGQGRLQRKRAKS